MQNSRAKFQRKKVAEKTEAEIQQKNFVQNFSEKIRAGKIREKN
jgi:hypothetical protein